MRRGFILQIIVVYIVKELIFLRKFVVKKKKTLKVPGAQNEYDMKNSR